MFRDTLKKWWPPKHQKATDDPAPPVAAAQTTPDDGSIGTESTDDMLARALIQHGVPSHRDGSAHVLPGDLRLLLVLEDHPSTTPGNHVVALELRAEGPRTDGIVVSSFAAGFGEGRQIAANQAFMKMLLSAFHVFLDALTEHTCSQCESAMTRWSGNDATWTAYDGAVITQQTGSSALLDTYLTHAWPALRRLFEQTQPKGLHWIGVFVASFHNEVQTVEVLLDSNPWPDATDLLSRQPWTPGFEYESARHFVIVMPEGNA
ncbi:DUF6348 family protein [Luteibacter rhizovicinus]|nr:DUF6348 family protein [Luteibacter rhizovicinus]